MTHIILSKEYINDFMAALVKGPMPAFLKEELGEDGNGNWMELLPTNTNKRENFIKSSVTNYIKDDPEREQELAKVFAVHLSLGHGSTLKFKDGYRNDGLLFWDNIKKEIVEPFTEIDDYGSVPPRFKVDMGREGQWLEEVDHNAYVFPTQRYIKLLKEKFSGGNSEIDNTSLASEISDWNSIFLEVVPDERKIVVHQGLPEWVAKNGGRRKLTRKRKVPLKTSRKTRLK